MSINTASNTESASIEALTPRRRIAPTNLSHEPGGPGPRVQAWMLRAPVDLLALLAPIAFNPEHWRGFVIAAAAGIAILYSGGRRRARLHLSVLDEAPFVLAAGLLASAIVSVGIALRHPTVAVADYARWTGLSLVLLLVGRSVTNAIINGARRARIIRHGTVVVGRGALGAEVVRILNEYPRYGLGVVGIVDDRPYQLDAPQADANVANTTQAGGLGELDDIVRETGADVVIIADPAMPDEGLLDLVRADVAGNCDLLVVPRLHDFHTQVGSADHIGAIPVMRVKRPALRGPSYATKRIFDLVLSSLLLVLLAPLLVAVAIAVRIEGGRRARGVIFRQQRLTRDDRVFEVLKFRSMFPASQLESERHWNIAGDQRVGPVGRFIRRTSFDELPQLWNILRGDMTFVGPRPERPYFAEQFSLEHRLYARRHRVTCGLTGLAQVSGLRGDTSISDRARYDNYYIENWSLWLDVKVLLRTFAEVLGARGK